MNTRSTSAKHPLIACLLGMTLGSLSHAATVVSVDKYAGFTFTGTVGSPRTIEYVDSLANNNNAWITLTNFNLPSSPFFIIDQTSPGVGKRFYKPQAAGVALGTYVGVRISGPVGSTNVVQHSVNPGNWATLTTLVLPTDPYLWIDTTAPSGANRTYRVLAIDAPPAVTSPAMAVGQANYGFSYQITVDSLQPVTNYTASGLPTGLTINPATGLISGTPTVALQTTMIVNAMSANGTGSKNVSLQIRPFAPELVNIPARTFTMGSPEEEAGRSADEGPQTTVTVNPGFAIGKYEVTQIEYKNVTGSNPNPTSDDLNRPVTLVSWNDAVNYCALLTQRDRQAGLIAANMAYRLPTEAEWEVAARGGTQTAYNFGNDPAQLAIYAWFSENSAAKTHPVGTKAATTMGLHDVHGNVWEWCSDWYGAYTGGSATNPTGPATGTEKVIRGGSWFRSASDCRSAKRLANPPDNRNGDVGFRIVLAPVP